MPTLDRLFESRYSPFLAPTGEGLSSYGNTSRFPYSSSQISLHSPSPSFLSSWFTVSLKITVTTKKLEQGLLDNTSELARYLNEQAEDDEDDAFDVLLWWKLNQHRFPILSTIAGDVTAIPISTVASEAAFSRGERVLDSYRSSLSPRIV